MQRNKINHLAANCKLCPAASDRTYAATVGMKMDLDVLLKSF